MEACPSRVASVMLEQVLTSSAVLWGSYWLLHGSYSKGRSLGLILLLVGQVDDTLFRVLILHFSH